MKKRVSDAEFVNESVEFFNERIDQIIAQLHESDLSTQQKTVLENEKQLVMERRNYWKLEQTKLQLCD
jgi:mannitol-1-phosphate/altronate dehydrogenase